MELLYVWIEDYKNIKKQGFNFSPKYWFDFEYEEDNDGKVTGGTLKYEERNSNYPSDFFGENISNATAIVGKNGSGKSSILSYIFNWHFPSASKIIYAMPSPKVSKPFFQHQCVFLFKDAFNKIKLFTTLDRIKHSTNIKNIGDLKTMVQFDNLKRAQILLDKGGFFPIFYSSFFSEDQMLSEIENPYVIRNKQTAEIECTVDEAQDKINLSTGSQIMRNSTWGTQQNDPLINIIYNNYLNNQLYIAKFISDNKRHLGIALPPYIFLGTNNTKNFPILHEEIKRLPGNFHLGIMEKSYKWQTTRELLQLQILERLLNQYEFDFKNQNETPFQNLDLAFEEIIELLRKYSAKIKVKQKHYQTIEYLLKEIINFNNDILTNWNENEFFDLSNKTEFNRFSKFLKDYKYLIVQFRLISPQLSFNKLGVFCELSSGEQMLLKMNGKLWNALTSLSEQSWDIKNKSILIMLDEADTTLHPEWQRYLFQQLNYSLNTFFKDFNIQLLLTSHSPFLVSDLPKENIIFLNKKENGDCEVKHPEDMTHTFGANIHSLYRNSFFLENGLMGEFAKGKIDRVIKDLNQDDAKNKIDEKGKKEMKFIIEQIGEPIIRRKLQQMYDEKFHSLEQIDDRIKALEEEIKQLKGRQS